MGHSTTRNRDKENNMTDEERTYIVYTKQRMNAGMEPYKVYGTSAKSVAKKFTQKFGVEPVKVVRGRWNSTVSKIIEDVGGDIWEA
jgi:hypothetical protein